jgi:hypothetical protein
MGTVWVESTEVAIHVFITGSTYILELHFIAAEFGFVYYSVMCSFIYSSHSGTVSHGFLKCCLNQILRNAPLPPIEFNGGSGSWNQTYVVAVI